MRLKFLSKITGKNLLAVLNHYSRLALIVISLVVVFSAIFIKTSLDHQERMLKMAALTYEQRLELRELNDTVSFVLRNAVPPVNMHLIDQSRKRIKKNLDELSSNHRRLIALFNDKNFIYHYWPFNRFYSLRQEALIGKMGRSLEDIESRMQILLLAEHDMLKTGFDFWDPGFLRTVRQGQHTLALEALNREVYQSANHQQSSLQVLHVMLFLFVLTAIWIIWALILKPLNNRTRRLFRRLKSKQIELKYQATHDALTGLLNRRALNQYIDGLSDEMKPNVAVVSIDVDRFKMLNDSYGHLFGDRVLRQIASCIKETRIDNELHFRSGGDEFVIIVESCSDYRVITPRVEQLRQHFKVSLKAIDLYLNIVPSLSIGAACQNGDYNSFYEIYHAADITLYEMKRKGGNGYALFTDIETRQIQHVLKIERDIKAAIKDKQFIPYYHPLYDMDTKNIAGFEALARWQHPEHGLLLPVDWINTAQRLGFLSHITLLIAEAVLNDQIRWQQQGFMPNVVTINLTERLLMSDDIFNLFDHYFAQYPEYTFNIGLEIHESIVLQHNMDQLTQKILNLQAQGFKILIDDFGSGYATINHLLYLPFDYLKTEGQLLHNLATNKKNQIVLKAMQDIAKGLEKPLVCEGVEDEAVLEMLEEIGVKYAQGFYFSKPISFEQTLNSLRLESA